MRIKFLLLVILQFFVIFLFSEASLFADSPATPYDYKVVTQSNEYIFIMLAPEEYQFGHNPEFRNTYKQSGLYKNDGSSAPLWTIDWYAFRVIPVSDAKHLIRFGPWASNTSQLALAFYRNGHEIKSYQIKDLVYDESKLMYTESHFFWKSEVEYQEEKGILFLKTKDRRSYNFLITNGVWETTKPKQNSAKND